MLGAQDFCGYYDFTFGHLRRRFGQQAVHDLWRDAVGLDSQQHYLELGAREGLEGLYKAWTHTGEDEQCDWTFTLDREKNVLRWDMRKCPSKGFLLENDRHFDEDYCDHCMGWEGPMLAKLGLEMAAHEHNHCGQCWGEIRVKGVPYAPLDLEVDIRKDPRWKHGFLDRFANHVKLPVLTERSSSPDAPTLLERHFAKMNMLTVLGRGPSALDLTGGGWTPQPDEAVLLTGMSYATRDVYAGRADAVLINSPPDDPLVKAIAERYVAERQEDRPLLLYAYLPSVPPMDFGAFGLPRPLPILPSVIRAGLYDHAPGGVFPTTGVFLLMLAVSLGKRLRVAGIDRYRHPSGKVYASDAAVSEHRLPAEHSADCDESHLRRALARRAGDTEIFGDLSLLAAN